MIKPFLMLQLRPEDAAADGEYDMFIKAGQLSNEHMHRIRMEKEGLPDINLEKYSGVIVGGGPFNISDAEAKKPQQQKTIERRLHELLDEIIEKDYPFLGACYGIGMLSSHLGGRVQKGRYSEDVGAASIKLTPDAAEDPLTADLPETFRAYVGHKESCQEVPAKAVLLAGSAACPVHMIRTKTNVYATQFHPEADPEGFALRISVYRHAGYFPPEDAEKLMDAALKEQVEVPITIFRRFVDRYRQPA